MEPFWELMMEDELASLLTYYSSLAADQGYHAPELLTRINSEAVSLADFGPSTELPPPLTREDGKLMNSDEESKDVKLDVADEKKQVHGCGSTKRSRVAAEAHNVSEKKRRKKISEKMKILRELIPHCNKTDNVSTLNDAIEYLKSLKQMVQMMAMGYGMKPVMFPNSSEYVCPSFPNSSFNQFIAPDSSYFGRYLFQILNKSHISNFHNYQPYPVAHSTLFPLSQNQAWMQQSNSIPRSTIEVQNRDNIHYFG